MDIKAYIESGIIELYVYGLLDEAESAEVTHLANLHPEIKEEIVSIENAMLNISGAFAPMLPTETYEQIKQKLHLNEPPLSTVKSSFNWVQYSGWAAALLLAICTGYFYNQQLRQEEAVAVCENEKITLQAEFAAEAKKCAQTQQAMAVLRDPQNTMVLLAGQAAAPNAFAKVYYNKTTKSVYVDVAGLPPAPAGKVYQVWSLKLNPLTPTSVGLVDNSGAATEILFTLDKSSDAEAFGITLEPTGGSASPTMSQLYTLGKI